MIMDRIALIITIIGALNWGSIGLFQFDLVAWICGGQGALFLADAMRAKFGRRVAGPVAPPIDKIRGQYIVRIMLKIENGASLSRARELLRKALEQFRTKGEYKSINIAIDVDAQ